MNDVEVIPCDGTFYSFPSFQAVIDRMDGIEDDVQLAQLILEKGDGDRVLIGHGAGIAPPAMTPQGARSWSSDARSAGLSCPATALSVSTLIR